MRLLGISGYARSGKDEFARVLVEEGGFTRIAFADKLREVLYQLNPMIAHDSNWSDGGPKDIYVQEIIDEYGWDGYKNTPYGSQIRRLLQRLGTEAGRQTLWDSIWVDAALKDLDADGKYVVTDMRFPNELDAVEALGGETVRIERRDNGPARGQDGKVHPSETSLDGFGFDHTVYNWGTLEEFQDKVRRFL